MAEIQVEGTRAMSAIDPKDAHVLVIEDHPDNLFIIQMLLNQDVGVKFCDGRATGMNLFGFLAAHPTPYCMTDRCSDGTFARSNDLNAH